MRDLKILFMSMLIMIGNAPIWASNSKNYVAPLSEDQIILDNGQSIVGEITKFGNNTFTMNTVDGKVKIDNNRVAVVAIGQELSHYEKFRLGKLDGKRYAENKGGNLALGFFTGLIGAAVVYLTSDQLPSYQAQQGANKAVVNDPAYMEGYSKGAASKVGGQALIGAAIATATVILLSTIAVSSYSYYY